MRAVTGGTTTGSRLCHQGICVVGAFRKDYRRCWSVQRRLQTLRIVAEKYGLTEGTDRESVSLSAEKSVTVYCWDETGTSVLVESTIHLSATTGMCGTLSMVRTYTITSLVCDEKIENRFVPLLKPSMQEPAIRFTIHRF